MVRACKWATRGDIRIGASRATTPAMRALLVAGLILLLGSCTLDLGDDDDTGAGSGLACGGWSPHQCDGDEYCDFTDDDCGIADGGGFCRARPRVCADIYMPVNGSDGETYGNACEAHAAGADDCGPASE